MSEILLHYKRPDPTTWAYLSSFLTVGLFFVFHRFWSMRNLDIVLLLLLTPGLLIVQEGRRRQLIEGDQARVQARLDEAAEYHLAAAGVASPSSDAAQASDVAQSPDTGPALDTGPAPDAAQGVPLMDHGQQQAVAAADAAQPQATDAVGVTDAVGATEAEAAEVLLSTDSASGAATVTSATEPLSAIAVERYGFIWLLSVQLLILVRLLFDPLMIRRPLLDPNLTTGGMLFISSWLFVFLMANVLTSTPRLQVEQGPQLGPGYSLMNMLPAIPTRPFFDESAGRGSAATTAVTPAPSDTTTGDMTAAQSTSDPSPASPLAGSAEPTPEAREAGETRATSPQPAVTAAAPPPRPAYVMLARWLAIAAHLAIVIGIISISYRHFGNLRAGVGCATMYLLMPYTAQMTGRVDHALPAALLVWAVMNYRRPLVAGLLLGAAAGLVYYPLFLLPLWISFYWRLGVRRFVAGVAVSLGAMMALLVMDGSLPLEQHLQRMFGLMKPVMHDLDGIWRLGWAAIYRLPILVAFIILSGFFAIWPAQKNLGTLIGYSAALMVAAQFWHAYGGGLYMAWFLPLLLLTIVRPNLDDRIALKVIDGGRLTRRPRPSSITADVA